MELDSLYQEIILDHYKHPRGKGLLDHPLGSAHHINPTCGDEITVQVSRNSVGGLEIGYEGQGCSISQASASVLTELLMRTFLAMLSHLPELRSFPQG